MQYEKYTNEDGYFGWGRPDQTHQERLDMARENFDMVSARESRIVDFKTGDPTTQKFMCWYASRKLFGKDILHVYQQTGSCVGASAGNLLNYTQCVEIAIKGDFEEFKYVFFPYAYGIARQIDGSRSQGDGSNGSSIAEAILKEGSIPEDIQGLPKATKSDTDWYLNKTIEYAWSGPSRGKWLYTDFEGEGKKHTIKSAARVTSFDEAAKAILNGYLVQVCSNVGYNDARSDGFNYPGPSWNHAMCALPGTFIKSKLSKNIEDIKVNDEVYGHDGKLHKVTEVFKNHFKGKLVQIKGYGCDTLSLTPNHPVLVGSFKEVDSYTDLDVGMYATKTKTNKKLSVKWVNASELKRGDYLVCPGFLHSEDPISPEWIQSPKVGKNIPIPIKPSKDLAWLFGLFIADGNARQDHKICFTIGSQEVETITKCERIIREQLGLIPYTQNYGTFVRIFAHSSVVGRSFKEWFDKAEKKHIPEWLFTWDHQSIIDGVFAGDGCFVKSNKSTVYRINNTSRRLIDQLYTMLVGLGDKPHITYKKPKTYENSNSRESWAIDWRKNANRNMYNKWSENNYLIKVHRVGEMEYDGFVHNFEVEGCHSYIANNISVHNCLGGVDLGYKDPYGVIINNWSKFTSIHKDFDDGTDFPIGCLRIKAEYIDRMLRQGDSYAYSYYNGFPAQEIPRDLFNMA